MNQAIKRVNGKFCCACLTLLLLCHYTDSRSCATNKEFPKYLHMQLLQHEKICLIYSFASKPLDPFCWANEFNYKSCPSTLATVRCGGEDEEELSRQGLGGRQSLIGRTHARQPAACLQPRLEFNCGPCFMLSLEMCASCMHVW